jgi:DHA1 family bicyclomycin/chloramphenicol resistance-like MFS transporter
MALGALASVSVSLFNTHSATPMVAIMAGTALSALLVLLISRKRLTHVVSAPAGEAAAVFH